MKNLTFLLSILLFITSILQPQASRAASIELDCEIFSSASTWEWNHQCWIDMDAWPDIPSLEWFAISGTVAGTAYYPIPTWASSINPVATGSTAIPITRFSELGQTWMNSFGVLTGWSAKYKTANFNDPYLWAPATWRGLFSYRENGVWYLYSGPEVPPQRATNLCAGCGASGIPYPGTP